jgi:hypothetical protein
MVPLNGRGLCKALPRAAAAAAAAAAATASTKTTQFTATVVGRTF